MGAVRARGKNAAQAGKSSKIHIFDQRSVADQKNGARVFQLKADLALAVSGIKKGGYAAGQRGRVIRNREFPGIRQKDSNHFSRSKPGRDKAMGQGFDQAAIFGESEAAVTRGVNQGYLAGVFL